MLKGGRSFDRPRPQRDHPNSLCVIRFHFIHQPTDYTLSIFLLRTSPSLSPISYRRLHPMFVIPGVGYRMMREPTVSPLLIGYSPINSACGTLLFSFSHPPSCGLSPITCLRVLVNYLANNIQYLVSPPCAARTASNRLGMESTRVLI